MNEEPVEPSAAPPSPAAYFGREARALRTALGMSQGEFASALHYQQSAISKVESGSLFASLKFAEALDRVAGTPGVYVRLRERLATEGHPDWFVPYLELERHATSILDFSTTVIMGILQTPEYATAVFQAGHPREGTDLIKGRVELRLARREVMDRENPPLLWVILGEAVLRTKVGGPGVMEDQLDHLLMMAESPNVTLQVLPFKDGAPAAAESFTVLTFGKRAPIGYADTPIAGQTVDAPDTVASLMATYDQLRATAASPAKSLDMIRTAKEFKP
ncbi:helix-turn-helix domain-containing protein [Streptomyces sp. PTM05]|uniref:Helix-turn-helix domain-containing protein n=1 Tax=Streptantibioticus parmotrematis TaxID=2873249 RepID=A0ABS7QUM8_9ACTN|nr:helix-turn-helix transcriptional regulator [Streptantibioticus parmotrematis]MBY8886912.1 helix-turn-helix domain-containing protein [Streptantibioticus parmotrematis]